MHKCTYVVCSAVTSLTVICDFENYSKQQQLFIWSTASIDELKLREIVKLTNRMAACLCFTLCCSKRVVLPFRLLVPHRTVTHAENETCVIFYHVPVHDLLVPVSVFM